MKYHVIYTLGGDNWVFDLKEYHCTENARDRATELMKEHDIEELYIIAISFKF